MSLAIHAAHVVTGPPAEERTPPPPPPTNGSLWACTGTTRFGCVCKPHHLSLDAVPSVSPSCSRRSTRVSWRPAPRSTWATCLSSPPSQKTPFSFCFVEYPFPSLPPFLLYHSLDHLPHFLPPSSHSSPKLPPSLLPSLYTAGRIV